jgi:DNA gyrase/topoisomerase IV subunit B
MTTKEKSYTSSDIRVLSDFEHVRKRTNVYLGNMNLAQYNVPLLSEDNLTVQTFEFIPAAYKAVGEIIDNALDEFQQINSKVKLLKIIADPTVGKFSVADNGRGVPIDKHETGKFTPEVVFGSLRSGRNFDDDNKTTGVIGVNGVGSSCTNAVSSEFEVTIHRDGKVYTQKFVDGASKVSKPKITPSSSTRTGTEISFQLDPDVFKHIAIPEALFKNRAIEIAMCNPDVTVEYNNERYRFKRGMSEVVGLIAGGKMTYKFEINTDNAVGEVFVVLDAHDDVDEQIYTWVNSSLLFDGGKCNTQFFNAFCDKVMAHLEKEAKKTKSEITRNDVRQGLLIVANFKMKQPEYDSQAKTRLTGPDLRKDFVSCVDDQWKSFIKYADKWLTVVLERAILRHHRTENKKAIDEHQKTLRKRVEGLLDATSRNRSICQLLITEGLSAKSSICEARNPETTGAFALTGKINNVYDNTPAQVLQMTKVTSLLSAIGLTPGKRAERSALNFGRIVIATDADVDGGDIFTLLVNLFYKFWPELFDKNYEPVVYRLVSPNVVASKGDKRVHFTTRQDFEKVKDKYKGWTIEYMKGLGSLSMKDWEMVLATDSAVYIPIVDDGKMGETMKLLFDDNADARKKWLTASVE